MRLPKTIKAHIPHKIKVAYGKSVIEIRDFRNKLALISPLNRLRVAKFRRLMPLKLNIGCGEVKYPGWVNIDLLRTADLVIDVRKGLPFYKNSVDFIYSEHFLEHLNSEDGEKVIRDWYNKLKFGGVVRIAMPDLDYVIKKYASDWRNQDWLQSADYHFIKTRGNMINNAFRDGGHKYLYNEEDLRNLLVLVGFKKIERCQWSQSSYHDFCDLETRKDTKLIVEATKA